MIAAVEAMVAELDGLTRDDVVDIAAASDLAAAETGVRYWRVTEEEARQLRPLALDRTSTALPQPVAGVAALEV